MDLTLNTAVNNAQKKFWKNNHNQNLLNLVREKRLNISPYSLNHLDSIGFNHLEIIEITQMIGKPYNRLTICELDMLALWEEQKGVKWDGFDLFNPTSVKMGGFQSDFVNGKPLRDTLLVDASFFF